MKLRPLGNNILIRAEEKEEVQTASGIVLPKSSEEMDATLIGEVVAVGEGDEVKVKVGEKVLYNKYAGDDVLLPDPSGKKVLHKILYGESLTCVVDE